MTFQSKNILMIVDITFGHVRVLEVDFSIIRTDSGSVKMIRNDSK